MSKFALEKYRIFPYVAWGIVVGFSVFVFYLAQTLAQATNELRDTRNYLEAQANMPIERADFTNTATSSHPRK